MDPAVIAEIRAILATHGRLRVEIDDLPDTADLYAAGMSSHAGVNVMLALEDALEIEFPDQMLTRDVFASVNSIATAIDSMEVQA